MSLTWKIQLLASIIQTITTYFDHDLFALSICSFIEGVQRETTVLIHASLAAIDKGKITVLASSHNCTKNKSILSLFNIFISLFFNISIIAEVLA